MENYKFETTIDFINYFQKNIDAKAKELGLVIADIFYAEQRKGTSLNATELAWVTELVENSIAKMKYNLVNAEIKNGNIPTRFTAAKIWVKC